MDMGFMHLRTPLTFALFLAPLNSRTDQLVCSFTPQRHIRPSERPMKIEIVVAPQPVSLASRVAPPPVAAPAVVDAVPRLV